MLITGVSASLHIGISGVGVGISGVSSPLHRGTSGVGVGGGIGEEAVSTSITLLSGTGSGTSSIVSDCFVQDAPAIATAPATHRAEATLYSCFFS